MTGRIEVIANGSSLKGVQLVVDTTLVSALDSAGHARVYLAWRAKERTYRESVWQSCFGGREVGAVEGGDGQPHCAALAR